jgi:hypothetical protein
MNMFNEFGVHHMMKLRQEEIERKSRDAWKFEQFQKEPIFPKIKSFKSSRKTTTIKANCECACC